MVLLGVRVALESDLHCGAAELVYSTTLHLPTEFFHSSGNNTINQVTYVTRLKEMMTQLQATPIHHHMQRRPSSAVISLVAPMSVYSRMQFAGL